MAASQSQPNGDGGDCYYLLMRDRERTARMVQQLVDTLQQVSLGHFSNSPQLCIAYHQHDIKKLPHNQAVRATPIPVTWMTREEDSLLTGQVAIAVAAADAVAVAV